MPAFSPSRAAIVLFTLALILTGMLGRVAYLETFGRQHIIRSAERQQHTTLCVRARRGSIFDRNGHELAGTAQSLQIYIDPHFFFEQGEARRSSAAQMLEEVRRLAKIVDCDPDELMALMREKSDKRYIKIAENQPDRIGEEVLMLNIPGVGIEHQSVRYYPMGSLAAHVLGSVNAEGVGAEGIELRCQHKLAGKDGEKRFGKDARRRILSIEEGDYVPPVHGQHIVLTIDANIQMIAEQELRQVCREKGAACGEAIVMDPCTGEILALANWPTYNPQNPDAPQELRRNASLVMPYEPGSILKPFIIGPALQSGIIRVNQVWPTSAGPYFAHGRRRVTDVHPTGAHLCTWDVIVKSSNQGATMIAERLGNAGVFRALSSFRFGQRTGVELPGEDDGLLKPLNQWNIESIPSVAQGYEIMVTPLQLARAFCVYANGGRLVNPHILKGRLDSAGRLIEQYPRPRLEDLPQVLDRSTADLMRRIMADVVVRGTGTKARAECKYWNIFGKTGTAHISQGRQGYAANLFNSSFLCGAPVENPRVVVAMTVHKPDPKLGYYGGSVSAPAAARLLKRVLAYMQVPQSPPLPLPPPEIIPALVRFNPAIYGERTASATE